MRITRKQKIVAIIAMTGAVLVGWTLWPSGPSYLGRPIHSWFYSPGENDTEAFRAMGQEAVPFLIRRLEDAPSERIKSLLGKLSTTAKEIYRQRKEMWQSRAAFLLGEVGAPARSAEASLTNAATGANWYLRGTATVALMKIRREPPAPLIEKLRDMTDDEAWYKNAMMVGQFGLQAEPAVPILLDALRQSNNIIQAHALVALGMIAREPEKCIPAIVPFLTSPNISDRQKAMGALLAFGTNVICARAAIRAALGDSDPWVRHEAELAMKALPVVRQSDDSLKGTEPGGATNRSQPSVLETNRTSGAAGSGR